MDLRVQKFLLKETSHEFKYIVSFIGYFIFVCIFSMVFLDLLILSKKESSCSGFPRYATFLFH